MLLGIECTYIGFESVCDSAVVEVAVNCAADYLECAAELSAQTRQLYDDIRRIVPKFIDDTPKYREIAAIENFLKQQA